MPLDPFIAAKVDLLRGLDPLADHSTDPGAAALLDEAFSDRRVDPERATVLQRDVPLDGAHPFRVRVYTPPSPAHDPRRALVWSHGGGFVAGTLDDHEADTVSREVCAGGDVVVVSVDYPLANRSTVAYPVLHESVMTAFEWVLEHADELGVDPAHVSMGGASAGGNLTLAAASELRDTGRQVPAALVLVYPALGRQHVTTVEHEARMEGISPFLRFQQPAMDQIFSDYVGPNDADDCAYLSFDSGPLGELPPMLVVISEYDDLRVSAEAVLARPDNRHLDVDLHVARSVPHGHLSLLPLVAETRNTIDRIAAFIAGRPHPSPEPSSSPSAKDHHAPKH